jgi:pimeloyl-ACP methyl ester carboxylesterase
MDESREGPLWVRRGRQGPQTLLLLHGLGANADIWSPLLSHVEAEWKGEVVIPDLRGHGRSATADNYSFALFAADVAQLLKPNSDVAVIGHSLGGALAALLGSGWCGVNVTSALCLSVKTDWSDADLVKFRGLADAPPRLFESEGEARERYARFAGLTGLEAKVRTAIDAGIRAVDGAYRMAHDPKTFFSAAGGIDVLLKTARCPVHLASGSDDRMAPVDALRALDPAATAIEGGGHNVHVENPGDVWRLFQRLLTRQR